MTRKAKFVAMTLSVVVLTTGGFLRASQAQESQGQVQPEETPGQVQERAVPGLLMPQPPGMPAKPASPSGLPGVSPPLVAQPPQLLRLPSQFYAEREKTAPPAVQQKLA